LNIFNFHSFKTEGGDHFKALGPRFSQIPKLDKKYLRKVWKTTKISPKRAQKLFNNVE
jgi:hypothetical protein